MPNLYGVANAPFFCGTWNTIGGVDIACPANTETNVVNSNPMIAPSQGYFSPIAWISVLVTLGATPPTSLLVGLRVASGADIATASPGTLVLVANANLYLNFCLVGPSSQTPWVSPGSIINISINPQGQAVTTHFNGTWVVSGIIRAPDQ